MSVNDLWIITCDDSTCAGVIEAADGESDWRYSAYR